MNFRFDNATTLVVYLFNLKVVFVSLFCLVEFEYLLYWRKESISHGK
jgi:hypothetical protein